MLLVFILLISAVGFDAAPTECSDGIQIGESCYFPLLDVFKNRDDSVRECKKMGGQLADVEDLKTFRIIEEYLRGILLAEGDNYKYFWTGMTYDPISAEMSLVSGEKTEWEFVWYFGFPLDDAGFTSYNSIAWGVRDDLDDPYQGFFNTLDHPTTNPLCQRKS